MQAILGKIKYLQWAEECEQANEKLKQIGAAVAVFGSARLPLNSHECILAERLARRFSDAGLAVLSGGGSSIMEAANKGAFVGQSDSVGLNIALPHEQKANHYQNISLFFQNFSTRKEIFVQYALAFVVFAGGFGTLDELFQTLTLMQTQKIARRPIILVGSVFWSGLLTWICAQLLDKKLISNNDLDLLMVMDHEDDIFNAVIHHWHK